MYKKTHNMGYIGWQDKDPQNHTTKAISYDEVAFVVYIYFSCR